MGAEKYRGELSASAKGHHNGVVRRADLSYSAWTKLTSDEQFKIEHHEHAITEKKIIVLESKIESLKKAIKTFDLYHSGELDNALLRRAVLRPALLRRAVLRPAVPRRAVPRCAPPPPHCASLTMPFPPVLLPYPRTRTRCVLLE